MSDAHWGTKGEGSVVHTFVVLITTWMHNALLPQPPTVLHPHLIGGDAAHPAPGSQKHRSGQLCTDLNESHVGGAGGNGGRRGVKPAV